MSETKAEFLEPWSLFANSRTVQDSTGVLAAFENKPCYIKLKGLRGSILREGEQ